MILILVSSTLKKNNLQELYIRVLSILRHVSLSVNLSLLSLVISFIFKDICVQCVVAVVVLQWIFLEAFAFPISITCIGIENLFFYYFILMLAD